VLLDFLPQVKTLLTPGKGLFYLLLIDDNIKVLERMEREFQMEWQVILKREVIGEREFVVRISLKE